MDEEELAVKFSELLQTVEALLSRPDVAAMISPQSGDQLKQIHRFIRDWDQHAPHLSFEQKARSFAQLDAVVSVLKRAVADFDQMRLHSIPVDQMGKA